MKVTVEDISRLSVELFTANKDAEAWSAEAGIDWEAMTAVIFAIVENVKEAMTEAIKESFNEERTIIETEDQGFVEVGTIDIGAHVASSLMQAFVLGWETRNQYGRQDD